MSVSITVTDPASMPRHELIGVLDFLARYAGFTGAAQPPADQHRTDLPPTPPMPAPQPPAPPAPVEPVTPPPGIQVDSAGMPWDGRIHSATRSVVADGTWRQKRGVAPEEVARVEAELRQTMAAPTPEPEDDGIPDTVGVPFAGQMSTAVVPQPPSEIGVSDLMPPPPPSVGSAVPPAPPVSSTPMAPAGAAPTASPSSVNQFPKLMQLITGKFTKGELTQATIQAAVTKAGLPSLPMLASRPDLVPVVATELGFAL